jgi:hypothetical protein
MSLRKRARPGTGGVNWTIVFFMRLNSLKPLQLPRTREANSAFCWGTVYFGPH